MGNGCWRPGGVVGLGISVEDPDVGAIGVAGWGSLSAGTATAEESKAGARGNEE